MNFIELRKEDIDEFKKLMQLRLKLQDLQIVISQDLLFGRIVMNGNVNQEMTVEQNFTKR